MTAEESKLIIEALSGVINNIDVSMINNSKRTTEIWIQIKDKLQLARAIVRDEYMEEL